MKTSTLHLLFALLLWPLGLLGQVRPEVSDVLPLRENCTNWSKTATLTFAKNNATAFDAGGRGFDDAVFDGVKCDNKTQLYPFIAIEKGQKGKVNYTTDSQEKVFFRPVDQKANVVQGQPNGTELFALDGKKTLWEAYTSVDNQDQILGKINVLPFDPKTIKLYIKPVDDIEAPTKADVENYLASVYGDYFINFEVVILGKMTGLPWDENEDGKLASGDGEHGSLATYTSEQRTLISAFKKVHQRGKDELVAFWAPAASKAGLKGFFPQGRAYGFIYATDPEEQDQDKAFHTLAHELGHGAFNLQHTFDRFGEEKAPAGTTDNLMDYDNGLSKELYAYQWPLLHKPLKVLGIEKSDGDSEIITENTAMAFARLIRTLGCANLRGQETIEFAWPFGSEWHMNIHSYLGTALADILDLSEVDRNNGVKLRIEAPQEFSVQAGSFHYQLVGLKSNQFIFPEYKNDLHDKKVMSLFTSNGKEIKIILSAQGGSVLKDYFNRLQSSLKKNLENFTSYPAVASGQLSIDDLTYYTPCEYEQISVDERWRLLVELSESQGGVVDDDTRQMISSLLMKHILSIEERIALQSKFEANPTAVVKMYKSLDDETKDWFMGEIYANWMASYPTPSAMPDFEDAYTVNVTKDIWGHAKNQLDFENGKIGLPYKYHANTHDRYMTDGVNSIANLFSPMGFRMAEDPEDQLTYLPAILVKHYLDKENMESAAKTRGVVIDVALLTLGVGEINLAMRSLKAGHTMMAAYRAGLFIGDVGTTVSNNLCQTEEYKDCEFCQEWNSYLSTVSTVVFLSASARDIYATNLQKSLNDLSPKIADKADPKSGKLYTKIIEESTGLRVGDNLLPSNLKWGLSSEEWQVLKNLHGQHFEARIAKLETYINATNGQTTALAQMMRHVPSNQFDDLFRRIDDLTPEVQSTFFGDCVDNADFVKGLGGKPGLVGSWKLLVDVNVSQALRSKPDKLTKVNRYLDNNLTKKQEFIEDLKNTSDPEKFINRTFNIDDIKQQYGLGYDQFAPQNGKTKADLPQDLYNEMLSGYSESLPDHLKEKFLNQLIESGSDIPIKRTVRQGEELFKVIPKGNELTQSSYYLTKDQLDELKQLGGLEQKLGLPLGSHSVEYDVYKAVAKDVVDIFESTVAPTLQKGYRTTGGATQSFILNSSKWEITKVETIIP